LIVAGRRWSNILDGRVLSGPSRPCLLSSQSSASSVAFHVHLKDRGVMDEAVNRSESHRRILEDFAPFAEGLIGSDYMRTERRS
jgi:hypothetical protein